MLSTELRLFPDHRGGAAGAGGELLMLRLGDAGDRTEHIMCRRRISLGEAPDSRQMRSLPQGPRGEELGSCFSQIVVPGRFT
jgi:hypothetical protein